MAYCQAQLYAQFMLKTYGDDALAKMLAAYSDNLDTRAALQRSFGVEQEAFEEGYLDFLRQLAAALVPPKADDRLTVDEAQKRYAKVADDGDGLKQLADECAAARELEPYDVRWPKLLARIYLKAGDDARLAEVLKKLADSDPDSPLVRKKLAQLALAAKDFAEAERWARDACQADLWDAESHRFWGQAQAGQEKYTAAIEELQVALRLDPDNAEAKEALASARKHAENRHTEDRHTEDGAP
jgi:tetratricopeptide (TPR) repeat protein